MFDDYDGYDGYDDYGVDVFDYDDDYIETQRRMGPEMFRGDQRMIEDISEAVIGQAHAIAFYERLAALAPNERFRRTILEIQQDERQHLRWFTMLLRRMGAPIPRIPAGNLPVNFISGVRQAVRDEMDANRFYRDIVSRATDQQVRMRFLHASREERRHAMLFEDMLAGLRR
jgi:rubrerythrin